MTMKKIDPRIKRTNNYLITALVELLKEKDLNKISVQNITDKANLTRATFYLHYRDKQDFFNKLVDEVIADLIDYVKQIDTMQQELVSDENIKDAFTRLFEYIYKNNEFFTIMLSDKGLSQFRPKLEATVQNEIYVHLFNSRIKSNLAESEKFPQSYLFNYITSAHIGVICTWLNEGMNYNPKYMAQLLYNLTLKGVFSAAQSDL